MVVLGVLVLGGTFISPKSIWQATEAWKYKNPEANEPSETALELNRLGFAVGGMTMIGVGFAVNGVQYGNAWAVDQSRSVVDEAVAEMGSSTYLSDRTGSDVKFESRKLQESLRDSLRDRLAAVRTRHVLLTVDGEGSAVNNVYSYTVSTDNGRFYCWRVTQTGDATPETSSALEYVPPTTIGFHVPIANDLSDGRC